VAVTACCNLLLVLSSLINAASFDLDCGLVEALLFKILQMNKNSPQLVPLSQALMQLCSDHSKLFSVCVRYIPAPLIPIHVHPKSDGSSDANASSGASCFKHFCDHFFEHTLVPDCVWTEQCRKELFGVFSQRAVVLPNMMLSVSDDTIIRPVIIQNSDKFVSSAQKQYTAVYGVYLELFVTQSKWSFRDSKALLEELFVRLTKVYSDADSSTSPSEPRVIRYVNSAVFACVILTILQRVQCVSQFRICCATVAQYASLSGHGSKSCLTEKCSKASVFEANIC
jgi:hypothetical protein